MISKRHQSISEWIHDQVAELQKTMADQPDQPAGGKNCTGETNFHKTDVPNNDIEHDTSLYTPEVGNFG